MSVAASQAPEAPATSKRNRGLPPIAEKLLIPLCLLQQFEHFAHRCASVRFATSPEEGVLLSKDVDGSNEATGTDGEATRPSWGVGRRNSG